MDMSNVLARVTGEIYDSASDESAWRRLPEVLAAATGAATCVVCADTGRTVDEIVTLDLDAMAGEYAAHYHTQDPWMIHMRRAVPGLRTVRGEEILPASAFAETEFYRDFARHSGTFHLLSAYFPLAPGRYMTVGIHRPRGAREFGAGPLRMMNGLLPHLQRSTQLRRRLAQAEARAGAGFAALSALSFPAIVCAAGGHVRFANDAALALAGAESGLGLGTASAPMAVARPVESRVLRRMIADAARGGAGGALRVHDTGGRILLVLVAPLAPSLRELPGGEGLALVALGPGGDAPAFRRVVLASLFGLTAAESALAAALLTPGSLEAIAAERGVSMTTVRTQLRSIFAKTGTESQRDVVRLLGTIPQLR